MDYRPLIKWPAFSRAMRKIIDQKFLRLKHFSCSKRRFLCIKLRDLHSLSADGPQLSPQSRPVRPWRATAELLSQVALT
jgi:hypothetical protein